MCWSSQIFGSKMFNFKSFFKSLKMVQHNDVAMETNWSGQQPLPRIKKLQTYSHSNIELIFPVMVVSFLYSSSNYGLWSCHFHLKVTIFGRNALNWKRGNGFPKNLGRLTSSLRKIGETPFITLCLVFSWTSSEKHEYMNINPPPPFPLSVCKICIV